MGDQIHTDLNLQDHLNDEEWVARDAEIDAERERAAKAARSMALSALDERGLPFRKGQEVLQAMGAGLIATPTVQALDGFESGICVISGNVGCGKSFGAIAWLMVDRMPVSRIRFAKASWFARTSRYNKDFQLNDTPVDKFTLLAQPHKLVIDDLGVEYADSKSSFLVDFDEMLDMRWESGKATVITTNMDAKQFRERYQERITDRIRDCGGWFDVGRPSLRGGSK